MYLFHSRDPDFPMGVSESMPGTVAAASVTAVAAVAMSPRLQQINMKYYDLEFIIGLFFFLKSIEFQSNCYVLRTFKSNVVFSFYGNCTKVNMLGSRHFQQFQF